MNVRVALVLVAASSAGCAPRSSGTPQPRVAKVTAERSTIASPTLTVVFDQEEAIRTNAPKYETDVMLPTGTEDWLLSVSCRHNGFPCRRASISLGLRFEGTTPADVRVTLIPPEGPAPEPRQSSCFEDFVSADPPYSLCSMSVHSGWEADPDEDGRRRQFRARIENAGGPRAVHVTISVIDPLE